MSREIVLSREVKIRKPEHKELWEKALIAYGTDLDSIVIGGPSRPDGLCRILLKAGKGNELISLGWEWRERLLKLLDYPRAFTSNRIKACHATIKEHEQEIVDTKIEIEALGRIAMRARPDVEGVIPCFACDSGESLKPNEVCEDCGRPFKAQRPFMTENPIGTLKACSECNVVDGKHEASCKLGRIRIQSPP
jgi:hypothetical protein